MSQLDHAGYTAPTRQHGARYTDHTDQECIYCTLKVLYHEAGIDGLPRVCKL